MDSQEIFNLSPPRNIIDASSLENIPCSTQLQTIMAPCYTNVLTNTDTNVPAVDDAYFEDLFEVMVDEDQQAMEDNVDIDVDVDDIIEAQPSSISIDMSSIFSMNQAFETHEDATTFVKRLGQSNRVVIIKAKSEIGGKRTPFIEFKCEREGVQRDHRKGGKYVKSDCTTGKNKPRDSKSRKCGCPFKLRCTMDRITGKWYFKLENGIHNHTLVKYDDGHATLGRLSEEELQDVNQMSKNGILPKFILKTLRSKDPANCTQPKQIYNVRSKLKMIEREERTIMQHVFHLADKEKSFIHCRSEGEKVKDVIWAHCDSLALARCFPSVLLMDCTYKTNRYEMPLLQIVGVTSTNLTFSIGFALLSYEREDNYTWALQMIRQAIGNQSQHVKCIVTDRELALMNAVRNVFPEATNLICRWHIEKGLASNVKTKANMSQWDDLMATWGRVVDSNTEDDFLDRLDDCKECFNEEAMSYISKTWLDPYKERFVSAWTNSVFHLGNTRTSRVEGMHSVFKNWKKSSVGGMVEEWEAGVHMVEQEVRNLKGSFERSLFLEHVKFKTEAIFHRLTYNVSLFALEEIFKEMTSNGVVVDDASVCACSIRQTYGLPCIHEISRYRVHPGFIPLHAVHEHWKTLDMDGPPPSDSDLDHKPVLKLLEERLNSVSDWEKKQMLMKIREIIQPNSTSLVEPSVKLTGRGRPKGSQNKNKKAKVDSTKRDPSQFEIVENILTQESASTKPKKATTRKKQKKATVSEPTLGCGSFAMMYLPYLPKQVHEHLVSIVNVASDGNCGYRVVALGVGRTEEEWSLVRQACLNELIANKDHYLKLFKHEETYKNCLWSVDHKKGSCQVDKWYTSSMSWVICNVFGMVVTILTPNPNTCHTFIPTLKPLNVKNPNHLWMVHKDRCHFVKAEMKDTCPVPHLSWNNIHIQESKESMEWLQCIEYQMTRWEHDGSFDMCNETIVIDS